MGKRESQTILKTDERSIHLELGREGKFTPRSSGWGENRVSLRATSSRSGRERRLGAHASARGAATGGRTAPMLFSGRLKGVSTAVTPLLKRRCDRRNAVPWPIEAASMSVMKMPTLALGRRRGRTTANEVRDTSAIGREAGPSRAWWSPRSNGTLESFLPRRIHCHQQKPSCRAGCRLLQRANHSAFIADRQQSVILRTHHLRERGGIHSACSAFSSALASAADPRLGVPHVETVDGRLFALRKPYDHGGCLDVAHHSVDLS